MLQKLISHKFMWMEGTSAFLTSKLVQIMAWIMALLLPLQEVIITMFFLLTVDFVSGIWASISATGWKSISSRKMGRSVTKIIWYNMCIITTYFVNKVLLVSVPLGAFGIGTDINQPLVRVVVGFIALTELKSVYENVTRITGLKLIGVLNKWVKKDGKPK